MDITKLNAESTHFDEPVECVLYDENGDPETDSHGNTVAVFVVSEFSEAVRKADRLNRAKLVKLTRRYGQYENIPQAEMDAMGLDRIAASITDWRGFESAGQPFSYSPTNALLIVKGLQAHRPKQLAQIEAAVASHASFFTSRSAT